jgi:hypothetical protein
MTSGSQHLAMPDLREFGAFLLSLRHILNCRVALLHETPLVAPKL